MATIYNNHRVVKGWLPLIRRVRQDMGLTEAQYSDETVLALIQIESGGDPYAHRSGSQYYGLLQIGTDNGAANNLDPSTLVSMDRTTAAETSIRHFFVVSEKYKSRHEYDPRKVAIGWKAGYGTLRTYNALEAADVSNAELTSFLDKRWNTDEYVKRFEEAHAFWSENGERVTPEAPREEGDFFTLARAVTSGTSKHMSMSVPFGCTRSVIAASNGGGVFVNGTPVPPSQEGSGASALMVPLVEARPTKVGAEGAAQARRASTNVLAYLEGQYLQDLATYKEGAYVRYRTRNGYTESDYRRISAFVDDAVRGTYETQFRAVFDRALVSWVRPLVNPVIGNSPWGKKRNFPARARSPGESKIILSDPETGEPLFRRHFGIDYATLKNGFGKNQPCYSIDDGVVIRANESNTYGLVVFVLHDNGVSSRYSHLAEFRVKKGDTVKRGQVVGITGASEGNASTTDRRGFVIVHDKLYPHLHFEIRINVGTLTTGSPVGGYFSNAHNISIDPEPIMAVCPNPGELRETLPPVVAQALEVEQQASALLDISTNAMTRLQAQQVHNVAAGFLRAAQLVTASRRDFYEAQDEQNQMTIARFAGKAGMPPGGFEIAR